MLSKIHQRLFKKVKRRMTNSLPQEKCKLPPIVFIVFLPAFASVLLLGYEIHQRQKSDRAFAAKRQPTAIAG